MATGNIKQGLGKKGQKNRAKSAPTRRRTRVPRRQDRKVDGPKWPDRDGLYVAVWVLERLGSRRKLLRGEFQVQQRVQGSEKSIMTRRAIQTTKRQPRAAELGSAAGILAAMGSVHRLRVINLLLRGAEPYRSLVKATGLLAGPMYHHLRQLELAGLLESKHRNEYTLTMRGRRLGAMVRAMRQIFN